MINCIFYVAASLAVLAIPGLAHDNSVLIKVQGDKRCITSNGSPTHDIGQFPNKGNPNRFKSQKVKVCVDAKPKKADKITYRSNGSGVSITGIMFRPGTADWYDGTSRRGFSRDRSSG